MMKMMLGRSAANTIEGTNNRTAKWNLMKTLTPNQRADEFEKYLRMIHSG